MQDQIEVKYESDDSRKLALHYMQTLVDVARESFLILDSKLRVVSANPIFYRTFQVSAKETVGEFIYDLGNGQWNIAELKDLLEKILPEKKVVNDFEVRHEFQKIGYKTILLNAKQIDSVELIILALEDISVRKSLEEQLANYTKGLESQVVKRTEELADKNIVLEKMNKYMVGREMKMIEQKKQIAELRKAE